LTYRTANLQSCILYIYSTNIGTEYFKHGIHSPFFSSSKCILFHNSNIFGSCIIHILYIYSTNMGTEYFKHGVYSPFFPLQNAFCFIILTFGSCIIHIFYIYSTNIGAEYFKHGIHSPFFFPLQNAFCFIILTYLVPVLFTFYIFIQQIWVPNILNMVYTLRFFLFKMTDLPWNVLMWKILWSELSVPCLLWGLHKTVRWCRGWKLLLLDHGSSTHGPPAATVVLNWGSELASYCSLCSKLGKLYMA